MSAGRVREGGGWLDFCWAEIKEAITKRQREPTHLICPLLHYDHIHIHAPYVFVCCCLDLGWSSHIHPLDDNC